MTVNIHDMMTRRELLRRGLVGAGGLGAAPAGDAAGAVNAAARAGEVRHPDLDVGWAVPSWTPSIRKPEAGRDYCGPLTAISTNVPGIQVGELLPQLAQQADKYAIIRQHDARYQRPRDRVVPGADRAPAGPTGLSVRRSGSSTFQGT